MKAVPGIALALALAVSSVAVASDRALARFTYEEAEAAFQQDDIATTLAKLKEAERLLGSVNPPMLYLRVQARAAQLAKGPFLFATYEALKNDTDLFIRNFGADNNTLDMSREVYRIAQEMEARQGRETAQLATEQAAAKAGDVAALQALIVRYQSGIGVGADAARVKQLQARLVAAELAQDRQQAEAGDMAALERMAQRYEKGLGVGKDPSQAQLMRTRIAEVQAQRAAEAAQAAAAAAQTAKAAEAQTKIAAVQYFEFTGKMMMSIMGSVDQKDSSAMISAAVTAIPFSLAGLASDAVAAPFKATYIKRLRDQATLRAAAWGNPDSLMARALAQQEATAATAAR